MLPLDDALPGLRIEQMDRLRQRRDAQGLSRSRQNTFSKLANKLVRAPANIHLGGRSRRFDHHDLGWRAVLRNGEVLGPSAEDHRPRTLCVEPASKGHGE